MIEKETQTTMWFKESFSQTMESASAGVRGVMRSDLIILSHCWEQLWKVPGHQPQRIQRGCQSATHSTPSLASGSSRRTEQPCFACFNFYWNIANLQCFLVSGTLYWALLPRKRWFALPRLLFLLLMGKGQACEICVQISLVSQLLTKA